ncbi:lipoprotein insertase outer membrane protein LolB [Kaarinaea lacus]
MYFILFSRYSIFTNRYKALITVAMLGSILSACQSMPIESEQVLNQRMAVIGQRQAQLASVNNWELNGRISLVTNAEAWSGQLYWQQGAESEYFIQFNAPSGQGAMQLLGSNEGVELRLANGQSYNAKDAQALLRQETNWNIPIDGLWYWVRGLPDPQLPVKILTLDPQGSIQDMKQNDWHVQYDRYQQYGAFSFPRKIVIEHQDMKIRLIVTQWTIS